MLRASRLSIVVLAAAAALAAGATTLAASDAAAVTVGEPTAQRGPVRLLVEYRPGVPAAAKRRLAARLGVVRRVAGRRARTEILTVRRPAQRRVARALRASRLVKRVSARRASVRQPARASRPRPTPRPVQRAAEPRSAAGTGSLLALNDPLLAEAWALRRVDAPAAWEYATGSGATVVAVVDTGVDHAHPDLQGALVAGWDFVNGDGDASDDHGHGTLVAGIVAARANNGAGAAGYCPACALMPVKVIAADGRGSAADVAAGIVWAVDHGADVVNLSLVLDGPDGSVEDAVRYAEERDVVVVAGAGNDGGEGARFPAALPSVVGVAGSDGDDALYPWSSFGPWVAVSAPGCNVTTASAGSFATFCGTSSSAAAAAGLLGLARSLAPSVPAPELRRLLAETADPVAAPLAAGRIDAGELLRRLAPAPPAGTPAAAEPALAGPGPS